MRPLNPLTAYARSKIGTERALEAMNTPGMLRTALRFAYRLRTFTPAAAGSGAE